MRKNHILTTARLLQYPQTMVFLDTETTTILPWQSIHRPQLIVGHAHYVVLNPDLEVIKIHEFTFRKVFDLWYWLEKIMMGCKELFIYAHNWSFDFPEIDANTHMQGLGYELKSIVDGCPPIILNYQLGAQKVRFIDTMNYFKSSVREMGKVIGAEKGEVKFDNRYSEKLLKYCRRDVIIIRESMLGLIRYLKDNDLCKLTHTISSLALSTFVRKFSKTKIYIDGNEERSQIGRESYYGGRTEAFWIGNFKGPLYSIDINSQYPFIMQTGLFPYKTIANYKRVNIDDLIDVLGRYSVTAVVDLETEIPAYPKTINKRTCFPTGSFTANLSTSEIHYAINNDHITKVHSIMIYEQDRLFYDYVNYFYEAKARYKKTGNKVWYWLAKYMLNTLYGKFGQSHKEWELTEITPKGFPHTEVELDYDTGNRIHIMEINNQVFMSIKNSEARDSFPAIAAHVTAGARMMVQLTIDFVGRENVYYCDTDSLLLNQAGYDKIKKNIDTYRLGAWGFEDKYDDVTIYGPKDYIFGDKEKHKGVRHQAPEIRPGVYSQLQFATLKGVILSKDMSSPIIRNTTKHLKRIYKKGYVEPNGSVTPFRLVGGKLLATSSAS